jgi:uncharacterized protein (TIGR02118 family)
VTLIKLFGLIPKRTDIADEQFHAHWASTHRDLALRISALRRYVQSHRVPVAVPGLPSAPYEGVAEVWLDDVPTAMGLGEDPEYTENAKLDEPNFIDVERHGVIVARDHVLRGTDDAPTTKAMLLLRRAAGLEPEAFASALVELGAGLDYAQRVVLAIPVEESYADGAAPPYDAVLEVWGSGDAVERLDGIAERSVSCALVAKELRVI